MRIFISVSILYLLTAIVSCTPQKTDEPEQSFVMSDTMFKRCQFSTVKKERVKEELKLFGKIMADNNRLAQVYPIMGGSVLQINVELGDFVKQGQVLAVVRSGDVAELQKEKLDARSDLAMAEKNLQVARDLFAGKLNSEKEVIAAETELEKAKAEVGRIDEVYNIFQLKSSATYNILSPIDGFVVSKDINRNELLRSDKSDVIFSIAQIDEVWAVANVNESDISRVQVGYEAEIETIAYPDEIFYGKIDKVLNAIDPETKAMKAIVRISNKDLKLKPEMNATIDVHYLEKSEMTAIPSSALIFDKSKYWVMIFKSRSNIETRQVKVYSTVGKDVYVSSGLQEGEKIISGDALLIYDALND
jgi:cobalt-zinc-cadmium efflux system membrane fusion protein